MKTRDEVIALFRDKYEYLKTVCQQQIGPFDESAIFQNPDGGWQLNLEQPFDYKAAITLRPNDEEPHETHGVIGARWFQEGGVFGENGIPGWLGYPVNDEKNRKVFVDLPLPNQFSWPPPVSPLFIWNSPNIEVSSASSQFDFGRIEFREGVTWERANEKAVKASNLQAFFAMPLDAVFIIPPNMSVTLNEAGKRHAPKDIENAIDTLLGIQGIHVVGSRSWSCFYRNLPVGVKWLFRAEVRDVDDFSICVWREGTDIHATVNAHSKSRIWGKNDMDGKQFVFPNRFRAT